MMIDLGNVICVANQIAQNKRNTINSLCIISLEYWALVQEPFQRLGEVKQ